MPTSLNPAGAAAAQAANKRLAREAGAILRAWRTQFRPLPRPSARALFALQQVLLPVAAGRRGAAWREHVLYHAQRLAKLDVPLAQVQSGIELFHHLAATHVRRSAGVATARVVEARLAPLALIVAQAYVEVQGGAREALVAALDAELRAGGLDELLRHLLCHAARSFPMRWGAVLLWEPHAGGRRLAHRTLYGIPADMLRPEIGPGSFFARVAHGDEAGFVLDAANDPRIAQPLYRALDVKSVWAAPLAVPRDGHLQPLGVLAVAFDRTYECLPQERQLLLALAERSSLAIERARITASLAENRERVLDLSIRLLDAQEEERRRIGRDLHDATGQGLLTLRLYLEMALREGAGERSRHWMERALGLVDQNVEELRRLLAQLAPLALDEHGLEAALRLEMRRQSELHAWKSACRLRLPRAPLPRPLETLVYRAAVEGLHNVARHARARRVTLKLAVTAAELVLELCDDGVGLPVAPPPTATGERYGLAGLRERVRIAGGELILRSSGATGCTLEMRLPLLAAALAPRPAAAQSLPLRVRRAQA